MTLADEMKLNLFRSQKAIEVYQFRTNWFTDGRSERIAMLGLADQIEPLIHRKEFMKLFGGYFLSVRGEKEYLGVWGRRKTSRMRRILRDRGAEVILHEETPEVQLRMVTTGTSDGG